MAPALVRSGSRGAVAGLLTNARIGEAVEAMASSRRRTLEDRLWGAGPKRLLSLDGGGMRGMLMLGMLAEVERRLAVRCSRPDFRLCEYFDLIGGASTGAVAAAALALGKSCAEVADLYREMAPEPAAGKGKVAVIRRARFDTPRMEAALLRAFGDAELGGRELQTGLALFARRADTGVTWTYTNNPRSRHWEGAPGAAPSRRLLLRKLAQACAGSPAAYEETRLRLDGDHAPLPDAEGVFIDAATAGLNNPALQLFKVATLKSYGLEWPSGEDQLLMLSVGAGYWRHKLDPAVVKGSADDAAPTAARAADALKGMIHDTTAGVVATMQSLSRPPRPWRIDSEIEDMKADHLSPFPLLTFQRLDVPIETQALSQLAFEVTEADVAALRDGADESEGLVKLHEVGLRAGQSYFRSAARVPRDWEREILPTRFDPAFFAERSLGQPRTRLDAMGRLFERPPGPGE
jgi:hypothetical protein